MARRFPRLNVSLTFYSQAADDGDYDVLVGATWCDIKRVSGMDDETETDKYSSTRYKAVFRVPGNFTPLPKHRAKFKLRRENTEREMRVVSIGEPDLSGHWMVALLDDYARDN